MSRLALMLALCAAPAGAAESSVEQAFIEVGRGYEPDVVAAAAKLLKAMPLLPAQDASPEALAKYEQAVESMLARARELDPSGDAASLLNAVQRKIFSPPSFSVGGRPRAGPTGGIDNRLPTRLIMREKFARDQAKRRPRDAEAQKDYGAILFYSNDDAEAFEHLGRAIEAGDQSAETLTLYGRSAYHLGDYDLAAKSGHLAYEIDPSNQDAEALYKLSQGRASKISLPSALTDVGSHQSPLLNAPVPPSVSPGSAPAADDPAEQARRAQLAAEAAAQAVVPPSEIQQSAALTREAESSLRIADYPAAHARATQAIELNDQNAQAWNYRAMASVHLERHSDAVYDASYAIRLEPQRAPAWVTRSWAFAKQGDYERSRQDALAALEKEPGNAYAFHGLAQALAGLGDNAGALAALKNAASRDARFSPKYERALQAPADADMSFLFSDSPELGAAAPASPRRRFIRLVALSVSGGLLVALGFLHIVSASWREKVRATIRRTLAPGARAAGEGIWRQYELVKELGAGGMGVVFEARDRSLDRRVAIKKMRDEIRGDPAERRRFVHEARTVAALHHPNIVDIYSIVEDGRDVYLIFEHVAGRTLADRLRDGPLTFPQALQIMAGACAAVEYAHRHRVIHRDLKPSNIMVAEDGAAKVMDFGVARQAKDAVSKLSLTNTVTGTPPYMAPEQEQGAVRRESDVFALGVVLYEALSGKLPFSGVGAGMLLNKLKGLHEPLSARLKTPLPAGLDAVIAKSLAPDPERRYRSPNDLYMALGGLPAAAGA